MTPKRLDVFLQYYLPHVSGLTNTAVDVSEYMSEFEGFDVHVHATRGRGEAAFEILNSVHVHRHKTWLRLGRASFAPGIILAAIAARTRPSSVHLHAPFPESGLIAWVLRRKDKSVITYQCDSGITDFSSRIIAKLLDWSHIIAFKFVNSVIFTSSDYYSNSRIRGYVEGHKLHIIPVPARPRPRGIPEFRIPNFKMVGFLGRATSEKGLDVLLKSLDYLSSDFFVLIAGPLETVENKPNQIIEKALSHPRVKLLGLLSENEISNYYESLDVFVLPSTNSFEAFGIVQVEAISSGFQSWSVTSPVFELWFR